MECSKKTEQIKAENKDMLLLFSILAEIRPVLKYTGIKLRSGVILFAEEQECLDNLLYGLEETEAVICKTFGKNMQGMPNNAVFVHRLHRYDKEQDIREFLETDMFMPVIALYGIVPRFLREESNFLAFPFVTREEVLEAKEEIDACRTYLRQNPDVLQRTLCLAKTSRIVMQNRWESLLFTALEISVKVYCTFYRGQHNEIETEQKWKQLRAVIRRYLNLAEKYRDISGIPDVVKKAVCQYMDENTTIFVGHVSQIEGDFNMAVMQGNAVLYDGSWYYFPEQLFRSACQTLLDAVAFPAIKNALYEEGVLYCNATEGNYTVKKLFTNAYGKSFRLHFLKLKKVFFETYDSLGFEERKGAECCTLAISTEKHAGQAQIPQISPFV